MSIPVAGRSADGVAVGRGLLLLAVLHLAAAGASALDIALVRSGDSPIYDSAIRAFKQVSISGDVLEIDVKGVGAFEPAALQQLRDSPPKVFLVLGNAAARAVLTSGLETRIVYGFVSDPGELGLQGPQVGGVSMAAPARSRLEVLGSLTSGMAKVGVLHGPESAPLIADLKEAARGAEMEVVARSVGGPTDLPPALRELLPMVDGLLVVRDPVVSSSDSVSFILKRTLEAGKPSLSFNERHFAMGALAVLRGDAAGTGTQLGDLVNRALRGDTGFAGEKSPTHVQVVVNARAAENLGIPIDLAGTNRDGNFASRTGTVEAPPTLGGGEATRVAAASGGGDGDTGEPDRDPVVAQSVQPDYPPMALKQRRGGEVVLDVRVGADGRVLGAEVVKGSSMFNRSAQEAVMQYRFLPARRGGRNVEGSVQVTVTFRP